LTAQSSSRCVDQQVRHLLERHRGAEQALISMVAISYLLGSSWSKRRMDRSPPVHGPGSPRQDGHHISRRHWYPGEVNAMEAISA